MNTTNADHFSLLASLVGFGIAIYAIVTQPVQVDSKRPTQTKNEAQVNASEPAFARLWDDPFAVYPETNAARLLKPLLPVDGDTLFLVVPTKTQQYEEDRENRVRTRYAIQRALIDQGFAAEPGYLLSNLELPPPQGLVSDEPRPQAVTVLQPVSAKQTGRSEEKLRIPVQFFAQRPLQARLFKGSNDSGFTSVAVIWLPDVYACQRTASPPNQYFDILVKALRDSINPQRAPNGTAEGSSEKQCRRERWVFLGPSDSDGLAFYHKYPPYLSRQNAEISIVPYSATIAQPILDVLPGKDSNHPAPAEFKPLPAVAAEPGLFEANLMRLSNGDDILCAELLRAIHSAGSLPPHPQTINVTVFAEWDTLYGRALAETFAALAAHGLSRPLDDPAFYPAMLEQLEKGLLSHRPPVGVAAGSGKIQVTVIPYLRGLDGASSLYRANYGQSSETNASKDKQDRESKSPSTSIVEAAEGTTQFDYIRRLTSTSFTHHAPFWPQANRPDAVVIFGTDIYDKLVLLEFLRQQLRNCLYLTTDLDALYWHPHYLRFSRDLIVASAFPLQMSAAFCGAGQPSSAICAPVEFRDSYQSAVYLVVTRWLQQSNRPMRELTLDFTPESLLYRIGNTKPLPILAKSGGTQSGEPPKSAFEAFVGGVDAWIKRLVEPVAEGTSPFWAFVLQITVIGLGLYSLFYDLPRRMLLSRATADELWSSALALVPSALRPSVASLRADRIRPRWQKLPLRRQPWQGAPLPRIQHAPVSNKQDIEERTTKIYDHYAALIDAATTKVEVAEIALCLLSDLFSLRSLAGASPLEKKAVGAESKRRRTWFWPFCLLGCRKRTVTTQDQECNCDQSFAVEVQPFVDYVRRDLTTPGQHSQDAQPNEKSLGRSWTLKFLHFLDRRFPDYRFILVGLASVLMLTAICLQPVPFLVGPTTLSYGWRVALWLVSVGALVVTFSLFHRTCYEQHRFRKLVQALQSLVQNQELGLSNRQLALMLSRASEPVANLTIVPCAMVFLIYASHLHPLGGVPMAGELSVLLGFALLAMLHAYARLRGAALAARAAVFEAYKQEQADAARLITRLQSYADGKQPLQDDEGSLVEGLKQLIRATTTTPTNAFQQIPERIKEQTFRDGLRGYLESLIRRDQTFLQQLGETRTGVLAPLLTNPVTAALMIPIGGASGLTVIEWIVSNAR